MPLTGAVNSTATTLEEIIKEMLLSRTSERQGRVIDNDSAGSMEKKKIERCYRLQATGITCLLATTIRGRAVTIGLRLPLGFMATM